MYSCLLSWEQSISNVLCLSTARSGWDIINCTHTLLKQLWNYTLKIAKCTRFETMTAAIPVQCSNKWLIKPTGSWSWGEFMICPQIVNNSSGYMKDYIFPLKIMKLWRHDWSSQLCTQLLKFPRYYVLIDWAGGPDRKIFGLRSGRTVRAKRGPSALTESQIISRLTWPHSVNNHSIIWPLFLFSFFWWKEAARCSTASFRVHFQRANDFTQFIW